MDGRRFGDLKMTHPSIAEEIQGDANTVAAILHRELAGIRRSFVEKVMSHQVIVLSCDPIDNGTIEDMAKSLADEIQSTIKRAGATSIQFIRFGDLQNEGMEAAESENLEYPPCRALAIFHLTEGKIRKRFDVRFVVHRDPIC